MRPPPLLAGVSRGDLTPRPGPVLQGHWGAPASHSVLAPLEVRAAVFESGGRRVAIATLDAIGVTRPTTERIRATVERSHGVPASGVMVVGSHTHCAPATLPCMGLRPAPEWLERVEVEVTACIGRAARSLVPVTLGLGEGEAPLNQSRRQSRRQNRRQSRGPSATEDEREPADRRLRVLRIARLDGSPLATLFHYACHPTAVSGLEGLVSPDYPGPAREVVDAGGGISLFLPGCGGDLRPAREIATGDARSRLERCGRLLGEAVRGVLASIETHAWGSLHADRSGIELPFGTPLSVDRLRELRAEPTELGRTLTGPWAGRVLELVESRTLPRALPTEMQAVTIGPLTCLGIPGEPLQALGRALEARLAGVPRAGTVWPVGYANDQIGYLCTEEQYAEGGYEPTAYPFYDQPAPFAGEERVILDEAARLVARAQEWTGIER